ncbi:MAG: hypothetical protein KAT43_01595 [Nanoarchaeota archaeon]|nr:hypothetical protein [Nanoarchaeota archaeon]
MEFKEILKYYSRKDVQEAIVESAEDREIGARYLNGAYRARPDIFQYPNDIIQLIKQGIIALDISMERWRHPLDLRPSMKREDLDANRIGWDLILDIDCEALEFSRVAADLLCKALNFYHVSFTIKFSGRAGFHIFVPFESFPETIAGKETRKMFPEAARIVAEYLSEMIKDHLSKELLKRYSLEEIQEKTGKEDIFEQNIFAPYKIIKFIGQIDSVAISSRHLIRAPYTINQKIGLVSIPIDPKEILTFSLEKTKPENVKVERKFIVRDVEPNSANSLFWQAVEFDQNKKIVEKEEKSYEEKKEFQISTEAVPEIMFPPCIKKIFEGLTDGRQRSMFALINFLTCCGWSKEQIEYRMVGWDKLNARSLTEGKIKKHVRYAGQKREQILPPNCDHQGYYKDFNVCFPDSLCARIKNPVNYARARQRMQSKVNQQGSKGRKLTEEEKQKRRETRERQKAFKEGMLRKKEEAQKRAEDEKQASSQTTT